MKIVALVHFYLPYRRAGSETMLHALLHSLVARGHAVTVYATDMPEATRDYSVDGVQVRTMAAYAATMHAAQDRPDVVVSHHQRLREASRVAQDRGVPLVALIHNDMPEPIAVVERTRPALAVMNSEWIAVKEGPRFVRHVTVHPPVFGSEHATTPGDRVTLVNINSDKGGRILPELAERMPDVGFLGVVGGHGPQHIPDPCPPNLEIVAHTSDMRRDVWARTRILLMPSAYESYGMAAVEAMHSGIPVIAAPTPGLHESVSYAGTYVEREDLDGWCEAIRSVLDDWDTASELALKRAADLDPVPELARWVEAVERIAG